MVYVNTTSYATFEDMKEMGLGMRYGISAATGAALCFLSSGIGYILGSGNDIGLLQIGPPNNYFIGPESLFLGIG